jgi:hypothetical protein
MIGREPNIRILAAGNSQTLAEVANRNLLNVLRDPLYKEVFHNLEIIRDGQKRIEFRSKIGENNKPGFRAAVSAGGKITGMDADLVIVDDAEDARKVVSEVERRNVQSWFASGLLTRLRMVKSLNGCVVPNLCLVIMQRLHLDDLSNFIEQRYMNAQEKTWHILKLPGLVETSQLPLVTNIINANGEANASNEYLSFVRKTEALCPKIRSVQDYDRQKQQDPYIHATQNQQDPSLSIASDIFDTIMLNNAKNHNRHSQHPNFFKEHLDEIIIALDPAFSGKNGADKTGILVMGYGRLPAYDKIRRDEREFMYILEDATILATPEKWAKLIAEKRKWWSENTSRKIRVAYESNQGGESIVETLMAIDKTLLRSDCHPFTSHRSKASRAATTAGYYRDVWKNISNNTMEYGIVKHIHFTHHQQGEDGVFMKQVWNRVPDLEQEMLTYQDNPNKSPNRVDALCVGINYFVANYLVKKRESNWLKKTFFVEA